MHQLPRLSSSRNTSVRRISSRRNDGARRDRAEMNFRRAVLAASALAGVAACSGGGSAVSSAGTSPGVTECTGSCSNAGSFLSVADVQLIIAQAVAEAKARGINATVAVVDRVGNVLA